MGITIRERPMRSKKKKGYVSFYLDVYYKGHRHTEFLGYSVRKLDTALYKQGKQLAEQRRAQREMQMVAEGFGLSTREQLKSDFMLFFDGVVETYTGKTRALWQAASAHLKAFTGGRIPFEAVSPAWLEGFQTYLLKRMLPSSAAVYISKLTTALSKAVKQGILVSNPANRIDKVRGKAAKKEFLTLDELRQLTDTPCSRPEIAQAFLFSCFSGLRYSDVRGLTWQGVIDLPDASGASGTIGRSLLEFRQQKTGEQERLPLNHQARQLLGARGAIDACVFLLPVNVSGVERTLKQWTEQAGIRKHITYHCSRHTFAVLSLSGGAGIYETSKLLGHRDIKTTQVYAKLVDESLERAIDKMPVLPPMLSAPAMPVTPMSIAETPVEPAEIC